jgi:NADH-quinone oxidoreductase subunit M
MESHILSIILFTPLLGAILLLFVPKDNKDAIRWIANIFALGGFLISLPLVPMFWAQRFEPGFKFMEGAPGNWIPSIGAGYILGIDGISFPAHHADHAAGLDLDPLVVDRYRESR